MAKQKKETLDLSNMVYGKLPPQAIELEVAVLGAIMLEKNAFDQVSEILKVETFYNNNHQVLYECFCSMAGRNLVIDELSVCQELLKLGKLQDLGGVYAIAEFTKNVVTTAALVQHAYMLKEKYMKRMQIKIGGELVNSGYSDEDDVFDTQEAAEAGLFALSNNNITKGFEHIPDSVAKAISRIDELRYKSDDISGVTSGYPSLDKITYGWQPTDLIILAARPAVGKTAFALNLVRNAAMHPVKPVGVGFFSLEMSIGQLVNRILSAESEVMLDKISRGKMTDDDYMQLQQRGVAKFANAPIYIDDTAALNIFEFRAKARRMVNKHNVGLIIIDYLQLMSGSDGQKVGKANGNREQEISTISRNLKALAKELSVPIIALSQLSRAVETRKESKIPQLSDLRESGAIEQDADMVMFIYRPEYYEINSNEQGEATNGETHIKIAKHRNGDTGTIHLQAKLWIQKFVEKEDGFASSPQFPSGSNWKPVPPVKSFGASDKTNFDDGFEEQPF